MSDFQKPNGWLNKFKNASSGIIRGIRGQSSFVVHLPMAALVIVLGFVLPVERAEWLLLILCIAIVLSAELFNTSLESLARAITTEYDEEIRDALDISSGAVLVASVFAAAVGCWILIPRLWGLITG